MSANNNKECTFTSVPADENGYIPYTSIEVIYVIHKDNEPKRVKIVFDDDTKKYKFIFLD